MSVTGIKSGRNLSSPYPCTHPLLVSLMPKLNPLLDNCKPRNVHPEKAKIAEMNSSLDEMLEPTARHRVTSYRQALRMIKQFTYIIKDCNLVVEPEN